MNDSMRRAAAILLVILGGAALWWAGKEAQASASAQVVLWPKIDAEYQQELEGIVEGLRARTGSKLDVYDLVAFNAFEELPDYYVPWLDKQQKRPNAPNLKSPGNCSAFVATRSWKKDGQI